MAYCIYLRKSRADAEAECRGEGETLARHEKILTAFAQQHHLEVTTVYKEIISGETIAARPQMQRLLSEVSENLWDGVLVMDVDRLARGSSIDQGIIAQTFLYAGTKIITPAKTYDPANEYDEEYFEFGLFMSRREYKTINRRLQRGRMASIKEGKYVGNKAPYGYKRIRLTQDSGFTLTAIPEQAAVIQCIFNWYTVGITQPDGTIRQIGTSLIARELNRRHITPPLGHVWTAQTIRDMLINPVYTGQIRWNWRPTRKKMKNGTIVSERPRNADYLLYNGLHEGIITEETFQAAANRMFQNKRRPVRGDKSVKNPLAGLVICEKCGRKMQRRPQSHHPDLLICPEPSCHNHAVYLYLVEKYVLASLHEWTNGYILSGRCSSVFYHCEQDYAALSTILSAEAKLNAQLSRTFEAFETGIYDAVTFQQRSTLLRQQLADLTRQKQELQDGSRQAKENEKIFSEQMMPEKQIVSAYQTVSNPTTRNNMLREVIDHISCRKDNHGKGHEKDFTVTIYPRLPSKK